MGRLLARRDREGLTYRELAEETGVSERTLAWWSWKLRRERREQTDIGFVELDVAEESITGGLEVELATGHRIRVPAHFDEDTLRRLVAVLAAC